MARVIYATQAFADLDRLAEFLLQTGPAAGLETVDLIAEAVQVLENHPLIGRPVEQQLRELVVSRGKSGYLALYSYEAEHDTILALSVRHQLEAGYVPM